MARGTARGRNKRSEASPDSCSNNQQEVRTAGKSVASRPKTAGDYSEASRKSSSSNKQEVRAAGRGVARRPKIDGNHSGSSSDKSQTLNHPSKRVFLNPCRRKAIKSRPGRSPPNARWETEEGVYQESLSDESAGDKQKKSATTTKCCRPLGFISRKVKHSLRVVGLKPIETRRRSSRRSGTSCTPTPASRSG